MDRKFGLLDAFKQYVRDAMPGGLLNPEGDEAIQSLRGLLAPTTGTGTEAVTRMLPMTGEAWAIDDAKQEAAQGNYGRAALAAGLGLIPLGGYMAGALRRGAASVPSKMNQSGAIVWHGSPHKFDKFDMSKIGTGEGAQAYGHGLYVAESPEVAQSYRASVSPELGKQFGLKDGDPIKGIATYIAARGDKGEEMARRFYKDSVPDIDAAVKKAKDAINQSSYLYKVDIPDEAVARFLDWDKPLSQQAPEVQAALQKYGIPDKNMTGQEINSYLKEVAANKSGQTGTMPSFYQGFSGDASKLMHESGIPGIRYLDGGSRSAGQGSSNFVLFSDQLPRILEINGQATGLQPWAKGEWRGLLD